MSETHLKSLSNPAYCRILLNRNRPVPKTRNLLQSLSGHSQTIHKILIKLSYSSKLTPMPLLPPSDLKHISSFPVRTSSYVTMHSSPSPQPSSSYNKECASVSRTPNQIFKIQTPFKAFDHHRSSFSVCMCVCLHVMIDTTGIGDERSPPSVLSTVVYVPVCA